MRVDIIAENAEEWDVLAALIKPTTLTDAEAIQAVSELRQAELPVRYGLIGDLEKIRIVDFENPGDSEFTLVLSAVEILGRYEPEFGHKTIYREYLTTLVEAWLRDVAYGWKSEKDTDPPALEAIQSIGLAQALKQGTTRSEVIIETDPVRRDKLRHRCFERPRSEW